MTAVEVKVAQTAVSSGPRFSIAMTLKQDATRMQPWMSIPSHFTRARSISMHEVHLNTGQNSLNNETIAVSTWNDPRGMTRVGDGDPYEFPKLRIA